VVPLVCLLQTGTGERWGRGRLFVDHTEEGLVSAAAPLPVGVVEVWTTGDVRPGRGGEFWTPGLPPRR
jgi:hypothetical protein